MKNILTKSTKVERSNARKSRISPLSNRLQKVVKNYCCSKCEQEAVHLTHESFYVATDVSCRIHDELRKIK